MIGHELAIEQRETRKTHARRQPRQRDLGRVGPPRYHAFAEKGSPQRHAIQPANQFLALPYLNAMGKANLMQVPIGALDRMIDPGRWPVRRSFGAKLDDPCKVPVGGDTEPVAPDRLGQRMGNMEAIQRHDRPPLRLDPVNLIRPPVIGHGKHADCIGLQQQQRIDRHHIKAYPHMRKCARATVGSER